MILSRLETGWHLPFSLPVQLKPQLVGLSLLSFLCVDVFAHGVAEGDKGYIQEISGVNLLPFADLAAKHMVTVDDHLLFSINHQSTIVVRSFSSTNVTGYI